MADVEFDDCGRLHVYESSEYRSIYEAITAAFDDNGVPDIQAVNDAVHTVFADVNVGVCSYRCF